MKLHLVVVLAVAAALSAVTARAEDKAAGAEKAAALTQIVYVCPDCHVLALAEGNCPKCNAVLKKAHLLGTKGGEALLCGCGEECKCDAAGAKDGKCACGKDIKTISVKGMYVCPAGCPEISMKAGKCACGKEMIKVE